MSKFYLLFKRKSRIFMNLKIRDDSCLCKKVFKGQLRITQVYYSAEKFSQLASVQKFSVTCGKTL